MITYGSVFAALADPTRRTIFESLRSGPLSVGELAAGLPVSRPAVSQHLKVLKESGLVTDEALGTRRYYRIDPRGLDGLRAYIDGFWDGVLMSFKDAVESPQGGGYGPTDTDD